MRARSRHSDNNIQSELHGLILRLDVACPKDRDSGSRQEQIPQKKSPPQMRPVVPGALQQLVSPLSPIEKYRVSYFNTILAFGLFDCQIVEWGMLIL